MTEQLKTLMDRAADPATSRRSTSTRSPPRATAPCVAGGSPPGWPASPYSRSSRRVPSCWVAEATTRPTSSTSPSGRTCRCGPRAPTCTRRTAPTTSASTSTPSSAPARASSSWAWIQRRPVRRLLIQGRGMPEIIGETHDPRLRADAASRTPAGSTARARTSRRSSSTSPPTSGSGARRPSARTPSRSSLSTAHRPTSPTSTKHPVARPRPRFGQVAPTSRPIPRLGFVDAEGELIGRIPLESPGGADLGLDGAGRGRGPVEIRNADGGFGCSRPTAAGSVPPRRTSAGLRHGYR